MSSCKRLLSGRICLVLAIFAFLFIFSTSPCSAQNPEQARKTLETAVEQILDYIKSPAFADPSTREEVRGKIKNVVLEVFDFGEFSSRTVGPRWRTFSAAEKKRFSDAFADLLFNTYLNKITGYNGEQISYSGTVSSPDGKLVEVRTVITMRSGKKTPVAYRMLFKNGSWHVYDIIIENISLVKNYRTQFQDILNTATPDQLIGMVEDKAREVIAQGSADGKNGK